MDVTGPDAPLSTALAAEAPLAADPSRAQVRAGEAAALTDAVSLADVEEAARACLPAMAYEFIASGAADEVTLRWNREAYDRIRLRPRVLEEVSRLDTRVTLLAETLPHPILLAPTAYHRVLHPEGELATARGAGAAEAAWVVSTNSTTAIEEIAGAASAPLWFQLYVQSDRGFTQELVRRVEDAGCRALCLTVDTPVLGIRDRQRRARFALPPGVRTPHLHDVNSGRRQIMSAERVVVTWRDVEWLRGTARVPLLLKGILTGEDAERAVQSGVAGVIVSNHGGRNLDTVPAAIEALPEVAAAVAGRVPLLVDGGIRRGTDVVKALALGARAVLIGRPYLYGLAAGGAAGVARVVEILRQELEMAMALCGRPSLAALDRTVLWDPR
ncbi:MAG TPA: alpha-hydroxy acid oxidase [Longimicrobium sp.]|nr:alpha-hydroxy acid oxidase [Longimicrobium sp.]